MTKVRREERQEAALLDVVRLALTGDHRSLRQRIRNLLRSGDAAVLSDAGRRYLQDLLAAGVDEDAMPGRSSQKRSPRAPSAEAPGAYLSESAEDTPPPVLERVAGEQVSRLIREREHRHLLEEVNLAPTSRVLLFGPPGSGKTMTAQYVARQLGLPLLVAEPSQVLAGVMGESARNLAALMRNAGASPTVLFLDELDAYARHRGDVHDIAEPKRLVNALLLELDRWPEHSLLIAASNHPESIDEAVMRRFEQKIELGYPSRGARRAIIAGVLERAGQEVPNVLLEVIAKNTRGQTGADLENSAVAAVRRSIIDRLDLPAVLAQQFFSARFTGRGKRQSGTRTVVAHDLASAGWGLPEIGDALGLPASSARRLLDATN